MRNPGRRPEFNGIRQPRTASLRGGFEIGCQACSSSSGAFASFRFAGAPFTTAGFRKMVARLGLAAKFKFPVHPHMLRHACGFKLANKGVDTRALQHYLGHKSIQHTVRYTELSPDRFKDFWRD